MRIVVAGGHGKIALHFGALVASHHQVVGLIRRSEQISDLQAAGMEAEVVDLESVASPQLATAIIGFDALVFAAGAGPGSGAARKETVDYGAAAKSIEAAETAGVRRFVMVSAMGTDEPPADDSVFSVYLRAKARADAALMDSSLDWTVLRPGRLTDDPATGRVHLARHVPRGEIPRGDVAAVLAEVLASEPAVGRVLEVVAGDTPVVEAISELASTWD